jgi:YHS domain-containing protein
MNATAAPDAPAAAAGQEERTTVVILSHDQRLREVADRVFWLEDGRFKSLQALVRDPICGMLLEPERAVTRFKTAEGSVYFCSRGCRDDFLGANTPDGYTGAAPESARGA